MVTLKNLPSVGIVVATKDRPEQLSRCLESLREMTYPNSQFVVVDDGSQENQQELVSKILPDSTFLRLPHNTGCANARNQGARIVEADYLFFIDDDAWVEPGVIEKLMATSQRYSPEAIVGPLILFGDGRRIWHAGGRVDFGQGRTWHELWGEEVGEHALSEKRVDYVTGCALFIKRSQFLALGMFDARFFTYVEEVDLQLEATHRSVPIVFQPDAVVWHDISEAAQIRSARWRYLNTRNRVLLARKSGEVSTFGTLLSLTIEALRELARTPAAFRLVATPYARGVGWNILNDAMPRGRVLSGN